MLNQQRRNSYSVFKDDVLQGLLAWRIWYRLAMMEIKNQYRQNSLGPFWISINTLILITAFGLIYSQILNVELSGHMVYVASGLICWYFYSALILKGCTLFVANRQMILQINKPFSLYVLKLITSELIVFAHNLLVLLFIVLLFAKGMTFTVLLAIPAMFVIAFNGFLIAFLLAVIATRYRDVASSIKAVVQPLMFLTPIIWSVESLGNRPAFVNWNPFYHVVEIWRAPIVSNKVPLESWAFIGVFTLLLLLLIALLFGKYRNRIAFWL